MNRAPIAHPPLENGDRLTRAEFEVRYSAMPGNPKAELIDGVVYMPSPTKYPHGKHHSLLGLWLGTYAAQTPGVEDLTDTSLRLDDDSEPKPDALLRIECDGTSTIDEEQFLSGPVELVVEVAASSASYDLHQKLEVYRRHGCAEYLVVLVHEAQARWFAMSEDEYVCLDAGPDGVLRSGVYPGLWLDPDALFERDAGSLLATLRRGLGTAEHAAFLAHLGA